MGNFIRHFNRVKQLQTRYWPLLTT